MTTTLNCLGWMQNQDDQTPCTTAQEVGQLCNPGYTVSSTNFQESQYVPNTTTINGCTCSWSIYNLLSACSYCVGQSQYTSWNTWTANCGSNASNISYLPSGLSIPQGIPFWAATNPSTWENATFNVTQAANIAAAAQPDVTGGPLPASTTTASSSSNGSVGAIVGGVIGGIAIITIGGLFIFCAVRRRRSQRVRTDHAGVPSFNVPQPVTVPSIWSRMPVQPTPFAYAHAPFASAPPYLTLPTHSTTNLAPRTLPVSPGFSNERGAAPPIADAADMISPFLVMSPARQTNRSNTSPLTGKAAEALSERVTAPPGRRARLNPPPYSASVEPGSSAATTAPTRRLSTKKEKKRKSRVSGATTTSSVSRTSTRESASTIHAGTRTEQSRPRAATPPGVGRVRSVESAVSAGDVGRVDGGDGTREGASDHPPPAV